MEEALSGACSYCQCFAHAQDGDRACYAQGGDPGCLRTHLHLQLHVGKTNRHFVKKISVYSI